MVASIAKSDTWPRSRSLTRQKSVSKKYSISSFTVLVVRIHTYMHVYIHTYVHVANANSVLTTGQFCAWFNGKNNYEWVDIITVIHVTRVQPHR